MTQLVDNTATQSLARLADVGGDGKPSWIQALRREAMERFEAIGLPTTKQEEWRFTNVAPLARIPFVVPERNGFEAARELVREFSFQDEAALELVFVNGWFAPELSILLKPPRALRVGSLAEALSAEGEQVRAHFARYASIQKHPFVALNVASFRDGAYVHLGRESAVSGPIHLLFVSVPGAQPTISHPRVLVVADAAAEAQIVESYVGASGATYLTNAVTEIIAGPDARIDHCKLQQESSEAFHIATTQVELGRGANFVSHSATVGGKLTRNDLEVVLDGERAEATINGLVILSGDQHADNHTLLRHEKPNCPSHELYKHVLDARATGVFKGKIYVQKGAIGTDAKQTNKSLLLSDQATMNAMPALEIYADDVKCTHGSTTGPIDEDMVFYLRSRGVGLEMARRLLTYAFAADVTRRIKVGPVRRRLEDFMAAQHGLPQDLRITDLGAHDEAAL